MRKSQLISILQTIPGDPDVRLAQGITDMPDEDAIWTVTGDEYQVMLYPHGFREFLKFWGIDEEDETVLYEE